MGTKSTPAQFSNLKWIGKLRVTVSLVVTGFTTPALADPDVQALAVQSSITASDAALAAATDSQQRTPTDEFPLVAAVRSQRADAVKALLVGGADPDGTSRLGESSLHLAVSGDPRILKSLLDSGANPNTQDAGGVTPLMLAAAAGRQDNVELLLIAGARLDMKDYQGSSAKDRAVRGRHMALAEQLESELAASATATAAKATGVDFAEDVFVDIKFPEWFKTSFLDLREDLDDALAASKDGIMLFISASRCSYCKAFMDTSLQDPEIKDRLTATFDVIGLDIFDDNELTTLDGRQYPVKEFVMLNRASYTPTLIFFGKGGRLLLRIVGYYPPARFRQALDYLETGGYLRQTFRDYLRASSQTPEADGKRIIEDVVFDKPPYMLQRSTIPARRPLLIVFERPGCDACERFHRRVLQDKAIRRLIGEFEAVQLDASDEQGRVVTPDGEKTSPGGWYRNLGLSYHPAILFFDEKGKEVMRLDSETLRFRMEGSLQLVLERAYEKDAQLQRWRRAKAIESIQRRSGG